MFYRKKSVYENCEMMQQRPASSQEEVERTRGLRLSQAWGSSQGSQDSRSWADVVRGPENRGGAAPVCVPGLTGGGQRILRLENPRNSCYAIATLNLLLSCPPFIDWLELCVLRPREGTLVRELRTLLRLQLGQVRETL